MRKIKTPRKFQYDSYIIERGALGWYVDDWDWEITRTVAGPFNTSEKAKAWVDHENQRNAEGCLQALANAMGYVK